MSRMNNSSGKFLDADKEYGGVQENEGPFDARGGDNMHTPDIGADNKFKFKNANKVGFSQNPQDYATGNGMREEQKDEDT